MRKDRRRRRQRINHIWTLWNNFNSLSMHVYIFSCDIVHCWALITALTSIIKLLVVVVNAPLISFIIWHPLVLRRSMHYTCSKWLINQCHFLRCFQLSAFISVSTGIGFCYLQLLISTSVMMTEYFMEFDWNGYPFFVRIKIAEFIHLNIGVLCPGFASLQPVFFHSV